MSAKPSNSKAPTLGHLEPKRAPRVVLNCVEGWGKTSCGAFAPVPAILCAAGEDGYRTLLGAGSVPDVSAAVVHDWPGFLALLATLAERCAYETVVLDALGGFEALCHQHVGARDFKGDMGPKGFLNYHKGYDVAVTDWTAMLQLLERIHDQDVAILMLSHCTDKTMNNPLGDDFARYIGAVHAKTWGR